MREIANFGQFYLVLNTFTEGDGFGVAFLGQTSAA